MIFCFELRVEENPPFRLVLAVIGRLLDPAGLAVSINGIERHALWSGTKLTLDECVLLRFGAHSSHLVHELDITDLPASVVDVLNTLMQAGPEVAISKCDLCNALVPAVLIEAHTVCACVNCRQKKQLSPPTALTEDSPF